MDKYDGAMTSAEELYAFYDKYGRRIDAAEWRRLSLDMDYCLLHRDELETEGVVIRTRWTGKSRSRDYEQDTFRTQIILDPDTMESLGASRETVAVVYNVFFSGSTLAWIRHIEVIDAVLRGAYSARVEQRIGDIKGLVVHGKGTY